MNKIRQSLLAVASVAASLMISGCTRSTIILMNVPQPPIPMARTACRPVQPGLPRFTPTGRSNPTMMGEIPPVANAAHVAGCAGIMYQIAPDGSPINASLVTEWPSGYGFGAAGMAAIYGNRFHPPVVDQSWHYIMMVMFPRAR